MRLVAMAILGVLAGGFAPAARGEDTDWKERFLKEAPKQWEKYLDGCKNLQGEMARGEVKDGKEKVLRDFEFKQNSSCALFRVDDQLTCQNAKYIFRLRRGNDKAPWVLTNVSNDPRSMGDMGGLTPRQMIQLHLQQRLISVGVLVGHLPDLMKDPDFSVTGAEKVGDFVRVSFRAKPKDVPNPQIPRFSVRQSVTGGWLLLNPARYWLPERMGIDDEQKKTEKRYEYATGKDGFPLPIHSFGYRKEAKEPEKNNAFTRYKLERRDDVPDSEFMLTAYSFLEPAKQGIGGQSPWYLVSGVAGLACIGAGALLSRKRMVA